MSPIRSNGNQYATARVATNPNQTQNLGRDLTLLTTALASNSTSSKAEITIPLTCHTVPKNKASRLMICVSNNRNPAPMLKKNREKWLWPRFARPTSTYKAEAIKMTNRLTE